ncbi:TrmB family transcriptional regulator [Haloarcula sp. JP-L23]|uniref:TrmB family transcriptional regulator n=1 Tax=Haloarcula sp. JP-L23 TaxID=2716717 RepID=UPI00140EB7BA|nr:TrmB family transcriptional regulator [Haloarcula sp. JP-L23]
MTTDEPDDSELREELALFGLSDTEIDTYLALLSQGEAPTSVVADEAGVTQRAVYNIAERLEERGLVRVKDHASPTVIRACPPAEAIGTLSSRLESITPSLEERFEEPTSQAPEIQIVKSRETGLKRLREGIARAETELLLAIPEGVYSEIADELRDARDRGVHVLLLLGGIESDALDVERVAPVADAVRCWKASLPFAYVADNDALAMIGDSDLLSGPNTEGTAVVVSEPHLTGAVAGLYLSAYWSASTEVHVAEPEPLPATFDWFRRAVFHAYLHYQSGAELWAEIRTTDGEEITGRVTEVRQALVEPSTNNHTLEVSIYLETIDGTMSFGGPGAFIEDHRANSVTLRTNP